jgi:hypothetical protein
MSLATTALRTGAGGAARPVVMVCEVAVVSTPGPRGPETPAVVMVTAPGVGGTPVVAETVVTDALDAAGAGALGGDVTATRGRAPTVLYVPLPPGSAARGCAQA